MAEQDAKVLSYGDVLLRARDLELLSPPNWLNDSIISFYFEYLQNECIADPEFVCLGPSISFWLANSFDQADFRQTLAQLELATKDVILLAINNNQELETYGGGTHWSLLVCFRGEEFPEAKFLHFDSANGSNNEYAQHLTNLLSEGLLGKRLDMIQESSPQQVNGWDCGVYVLGVAKCLCNWYTKSRDQNLSLLIKESVTSESIAKLRQETKDLILQLAQRKT